MKLPYSGIEFVLKERLNHGEATEYKNASMKGMSFDLSKIDGLDEKSKPSDVLKAVKDMDLSSMGKGKQVLVRVAVLKYGDKDGITDEQLKSMDEEDYLFLEQEVNKVFGEKKS